MFSWGEFIHVNTLTSRDNHYMSLILTCLYGWSIYMVRSSKEESGRRV